MPLGLVVLAVGILLERERPALAFVVGYLSHRPGDVLYPAVLGGDPKVWFLPWPLRAAPTRSPPAALPHVLGLVEQFAGFFASPLSVGYLLAEASLLRFAAWLWSRDARPGLESTAAATNRPERL